MMNLDVECHPFTPYIPKNANILILGTFPPKAEKWSMNFYYPNWINDMWRIMGVVFYGDKDIFCDNANKTFRLCKIQAFLNEKGIALHDTASEVIRLKDNAADKFLEIVTPIDLNNMLRTNGLMSTIVTTGEKAASVISGLTGGEIPKRGEYKIFTFEDRDIKHYRMPSSSRAYPLSLQRKAEFYSEMFHSLDYEIFKKNT